MISDLLMIKYCSKTATNFSNLIILILFSLHKISTNFSNYQFNQCYKVKLLQISQTKGKFHMYR